MSTSLLAIFDDLLERFQFANAPILLLEQHHLGVPDLLERAAICCPKSDNRSDEDRIPTSDPHAFVQTRLQPPVVILILTCDRR